MSAGRRVGFAAVVTIAAAAGVEVLARAFVAEEDLPLIAHPVAGAPNLDGRAFFRFDDRLFWRLREDLREPPGPWGDVTDGLGLRNLRDPREPTDGTRVVCLGDSCTYGMGVTAEDAWPLVLDARPDLDAVNAGVPGYTSFQGLRLMTDVLASVRRDVVVVAFGANDALPWPALGPGGVVHPTDAERARQMEVRALFRRSRALGWLLARGAEARDPPPRESAAATPDGPPDARARVPIDAFAANVRELCAAAPRSVVLLWPRRSYFVPDEDDPVPVDRARAYADALRPLASASCRVVDVERVFRGSGLRPYELFTDDVHATAEGNGLVADAVAEAVRELVRRAE